MLDRGRFDALGVRLPGVRMCGALHPRADLCAGSPSTRNSSPALRHTYEAVASRSLPRGVSFEYFGNIQYATPKIICVIQPTTRRWTYTEPVTARPAGSPSGACAVSATPNTSAAMRYISDVLMNQRVTIGMREN